MTEARMTMLLAAYGADPARWPAEERDDALGWLAAHPEAFALRDEAGALDAALALDAAEHAPSAALTARVLQAASGATVVAFPARRWNAGALAALAACAVMGVVIGFSASGVDDDAMADADAAFGAAFGVGDLSGSDG